MKILFAVVVLIAIFSALFLSGCKQPPDIISAGAIKSCKIDSDCIIVDSLKCDCNCKEAIAKEDLEFWNEQIALHANDACEFECGACDDNEVTEARCFVNICEKAYPEYVPDERVYGMPIEDKIERPLPHPIGDNAVPANINPPEAANIPSLPPLPIPGGAGG
ncbi:hypothetical protein HYY71_06290 [Candidatus Woesearchaeota archaeon]|nr:hypothetical protein [Candidatus Woesearchaeota archaeon]